MKKYCKLLLLILIVAGSMIYTVNISANVNIKIDKTNFPDNQVREVIKEEVDKNKDGYLSEKEAKQIEKLKVDQLKMLDSPKNEYLFSYKAGKKEEKKRKEFGELDCKGLQYFTNLKELSLNSYYGIEKFNTFKNIKHVLQNDSIEKLELSGYNNCDTLDLSKLKKLKVFIGIGINAKKYILSNNKKLEKVEISGSPRVSQLDFSKNKKLKTLRVNSCGKIKIIFPKKNQISRLDLKENYIFKINLSRINKKTLKYIDIKRTEIEQIDVSKFKQLKKLKVAACTEVIKTDEQDFKLIKYRETFLDFASHWYGSSYEKYLK